jgi:hypothetical protein
MGRPCSAVTLLDKTDAETLEILVYREAIALAKDINSSRPYPS